MAGSDEFFISVDVETSGPNPGDYALLSIGACTLDEPRQDFYNELKPTIFNFLPGALEVCGLSLETLQETGVPAKEVMQQFDRWVQSVTPHNMRPIFAAFNAPFDWMFVNDYFHRHLGYNPFGHSALDIKALYMGIRKTSWADTTYNKIIQSLGLNTPLLHHALDDAIQQAVLLNVLLKELEGERDERRLSGRAGENP
jgi:DNA polymerase III epsilon subunit-like protein